MDSSSDKESSCFWDDLSQDPSHFYQKHIENSTNLPRPKPPIEKSIEYLRKSKKAKEITVRLSEQEKIRGYIQYSVANLKSKFDEKIEKYKSSNSIFLSELYNKSKDFKIIYQYLIDSEVLITQHRITKRKKEKALPIKEDKAALIKELNLTKTKVEAMKRAVKIFRDETETNQEKLKELQVTLNSIKSDSSLTEYLEVEENIEPAGKPEKNCKYQEELNQDKEALFKELKDLEEKSEKNKEKIEALQKELGLAKKVIQNPQLSHQIHPKLQDYLEEIEDLDKISISSSSLAFKGRRRVYSNRAINYFISSDTKPNTAPETSNFKYYSLKPTLHSNLSLFTDLNKKLFK